jgi:1-acyl-sn-glycerol-3-phosphate acyltransferase
MENVTRDLVYRMATYLFRTLNNYEFKTLGDEVPEQAVISSNHFGSLDPLLISRGLERKLITITKGSGKLFHPPHIIPCIGRIDLSKGLKKTLKSAQEYKQRGYSILIFPEGDVSTKIDEKEVWEMKRGIFYFSEKLDLPILPISIRGVGDIWPKNNNQRFPRFRGRVTINVGKKIKQSEIRDYSCDRLRTKISNLYQQSNSE